MSQYVGFIGLGNMGSRMVTNLLKKGERLKVYDVLPSATRALKGDVEVCQNTREVVENTSFVITMLPNGDIVEETLLGDKGILKHMKKGSFLLDSSTIAPKTAKNLNTSAKKYGVNFLDAPVSGGVTGAEAGTLTFMIGGDKNLIPQFEALLLKMGKRVVHCGEPGAGQIAKLCNNAILAATMGVTAEALNLGIKMGLDPHVLTSIVNTSTGQSWTSSTYNPVPGILDKVPSARGYNDGFSCNLVAKDLGLVENTATECSVPVPLSAAIHQLYRTMITHGYGNKDFSVIYEFLKGKDNLN